MLPSVERLICTMVTCDEIGVKFFVVNDSYVDDHRSLIKRNHLYIDCIDHASVTYESPFIELTREEAICFKVLTE